MAESQQGDTTAAGWTSPQQPVPELEPVQLEKLTEMVYRLMQRELLLARERRGESKGRDWR